MMDLDIEKLITAIEKGKVRGFDEVKEINGENYLFEYAIKKQDEKYHTYFSIYRKIKWQCLRTIPLKTMPLKKLVRFPI